MHFHVPPPDSNVPTRHHDIFVNDNDPLSTFFPKNTLSQQTTCPYCPSKPSASQNAAAVMFSAVLRLLTFHAQISDLDSPPSLLMHLYLLLLNFPNCVNLLLFSVHKPHRYSWLCQRTSVLSWICIAHHKQPTAQAARHKNPLFQITNTIHIKERTTGLRGLDFFYAVKHRRKGAYQKTVPKSLRKSGSRSCVQCRRYRTVTIDLIRLRICERQSGHPQ